MTQLRLIEIQYHNSLTFLLKPCTRLRTIKIYCCFFTLEKFLDTFTLSYKFVCILTPETPFLRIRIYESCACVVCQRVCIQGGVEGLTRRPAAPDTIQPFPRLHSATGLRPPSADFRHTPSTQPRQSH